MFFAPWCGHCKAMKDDWNQLAGHYNEKEPEAIKIVKVDCTAGKSFCKSLGVKGYPTLKLFLPGKDAIPYTSKRTFEDLKKFVTETLQENIDSDESNAKKSDVPDAEQVAEGPIDGMYNLTGMAFYRETMKGDVIVMFIQDGSELSYKVEVTWKKVAKFYEDNENVKIGQVNCLKDEDLCESVGTLGFPMLKFYHDGNEIESHSISQNANSLISYVQRKLEKPPAEVKDNVKKLTDKTIKDVISTGITFLKFYHPSCGFCIRMQRAWKQLGNEDFSSAAGPVVIAELDCKEYETACRENGCRGFPSLVLFMNGEIIARYISTRNAESMKEFVLQMSNGYQPKDHHRDEL